MILKFGEEVEHHVTRHIKGQKVKGKVTRSLNLSAPTMLQLGDGNFVRGENYHCGCLHNSTVSRLTGQMNRN